VTIAATPDSAHYFTGWSGDAAGMAGSIAVLLDRAKFVQAQFAPKAAQAISFTLPGDQNVGANIPLTATSSSGLPVSFVVLGGPATFNNGTLTVTGPGAVTIQAVQPATPTPSRRHRSPGRSMPPPRPCSNTRPPRARSSRRAGPRRRPTMFSATPDPMRLIPCLLLSAALLRAAEPSELDRPVENLRLENAPLPAALRTLARATGVTIHIEPDVTGDVTVEISHGTLRSALVALTRAQRIPL
jgi:hypothetical protein